MKKQKTAYNFTTNKEYQGYNAMVLNMLPFKEKAYAGYQQWKKAGYQVKKGSKGVAIKIIFTKEEKKLCTAKTIFNIEQVEKIK